MTKTEATAIDGEVINDAAQDEKPQSRAVSTRTRKPAAVVQQAQPIDPLAIYQMAIEKGAPIEVIKQTYELIRLAKADNAREAYNAAISSARAAMPVIVKNARVAYEAKQSNGKVDYVHETLAQIAEQIDPILADHGLSYRFRPTQPAPGQLAVTCIISHSMGHSEECTMVAGVDIGAGKNHLQAIGSATTYLSRYTLKAALGLAAAEMDDDGVSVPDPQKPKPTVPRASASGGGNGQKSDPISSGSAGKRGPHEIKPNGREMSVWALDYIDAIKTANTLSEVKAWDTANAALLDKIYEANKPLYVEINTAVKNHQNVLGGGTKVEQRPAEDKQQAKAENPPPAQSKWTMPDPNRDYESFLSSASDKLRNWTAEAGDLEEFWNEVIEPNVSFPGDKDDLLSEYRKAEHRLGG